MTTFNCSTVLSWIIAGPNSYNKIFLLILFRDRLRFKKNERLIFSGYQSFDLPLWTTTVISYYNYMFRIGSRPTAAGSTVTGSRDTQVVSPVSGTSLFHARCTSFHVHSSMLDFCLRSFVFFQSCCCRAQVLGTTLVQEFHILFTRTFSFNFALLRQTLT